MASLTEPEGRPLVEAESPGRSFRPGYFIFGDDGTMYAQQFDLARKELTGERIAVASAAANSSIAMPAAVADDGTFAYRSRSVGSRRLVWLDRSGRSLGFAGSETEGVEIELSPSGRRGAFVRTTAGNNDIWLVDLDRGLSTRFTSDMVGEIWPVWSPDGNSVAFQKGRELYVRSLAGEERQLLAATDDAVNRSSDWSRDGAYLLYQRQSASVTGDIWALPISRPEKPFPVVESRFEEARGQFSPDGQWVSYESDETGRVEVYARPFRRPGSAVQISVGGGIEARWHPSGRELFYINPDSKLMAVSLQVAVDRATINPASPRELFATRIYRGGTQPAEFKFQYAVSHDGSRFLINQVLQDAAAPPITVVLNWKPPG